MENRETQDRKCIEKMGILLNHPEKKKRVVGHVRMQAPPLDMLITGAVH